MRSVEGRWGTVWFYGKDEYVGKSLYNYGEYNPDETEMIISLASEKKGLCLDIGANFGVMAQALEHEGFECAAFEPQPDVFKVMDRNVRGLKYNCALASTKGFAKMAKILTGDRANYGGNGLGTRSDLGSIEVPVHTLDEFGFRNVTFIKMDVEGYEEEALRGGYKTIMRDRPIMYIEDDRAQKSKSLREYIRSLGYTIQEHKPLLYREKNFFGKKKNVWAPHNFASHNIICRPC